MNSIVLKSGEESVFPCNTKVLREVEKGNPKECNYYSVGISKRFYAACAAMQGILSSCNTHNVNFDVKLAYEYADELIKQENETNKKKSI